MPGYAERGVSELVSSIPPLAGQSGDFIPVIRQIIKRIKMKTVASCANLSMFNFNNVSAIMTSKKLPIPFFIVLSVFLFNLPYLFVDCLWHDDGLLYYLASGGVNNIHTFSAYGMKAKICILAPFLDWSYSHSMVYIGLPFTRGVFVSIMALTSLLLYYLYPIFCPALKVYR
jgi:hypothetical protein